MILRTFLLAVALLYALGVTVNEKDCGKLPPLEYVENTTTILPWMVNLLFWIPGGRFPEQCTGFLITNRHVLTSSHCTPGQMWGITVIYRSSSSQTIRQIDAEGYRVSSIHPDIMVVKLLGPVSATTICLSNAKVEDLCTSNNQTLGGGFRNLSSEYHPDAGFSLPTYLSGRRGGRVKCKPKSKREVKKLKINVQELSVFNITACPRMSSGKIHTREYNCMDSIGFGGPLMAVDGATGKYSAIGVHSSNAVGANCAKGMVAYGIFAGVQNSLRWIEESVRRDFNYSYFRDESPMIFSYKLSGDFDRLAVNI